ncbi:CDP-glycerol glycerophosphotransferase family protein [Inconstantimicrobium mannanitabidum]|uniref:CDP-glycerol glycerophosphotransferase family protein n=1 Tax=Inconstantimicrobium mannanitabidum TaxID=1604901 RepID=UPI0021C2775E|nr:CDP-glycerol glycerophosphotransferase family protein [Clostridium sp. TW13]
MTMVKLRFILSGGKKVDMNSGRIPYVIFSDNKRYWNVFEPICREFDRRGIDIVYMTASPDDPVLECPYEHVKGKFIGKNNLAFAKLNYLNATIVLSTTPGLDVYQWKRSKEVQCYVHILHAAGEVTLYRMFGIDYYDSMLLSSQYQLEDVRKLEQLRQLPEKEVCIVGLPYMDEMVQRLENSGPVEAHDRTVLLAPSWGPSAIFSKFGGDIIKILLKTGYHVIVRPHPQSFDSEKDMIAKIMNEYPESEQLEWNRDVDNFDVLKRSDILISDFSGVTFDFALVYDKPIIYADTKFDKAPYDAWWLEEDLWTNTALPRIGMKLTEEKMDSLKEMIDTCLEDPKYAKGRIEVRNETWEYFGEGTKRTVDWLLNKYSQLTKEEEDK